MKTIKVLIHIFLAVASFPFAMIGILFEFAAMGIEEGRKMHQFLYEYLTGD